MLHNGEATLIKKCSRKQHIDDNILLHGAQIRTKSLYAQNSFVISDVWHTRI